MSLKLCNVVVQCQGDGKLCPRPLIAFSIVIAHIICLCQSWSRCSDLFRTSNSRIKRLDISSQRLWQQQNLCVLCRVWRWVKGLKHHNNISFNIALRTISHWRSTRAVTARIKHQMPDVLELQVSYLNCTRSRKTRIYSFQHGATALHPYR